MEIMIVGYVIDIRKRLGRGEWILGTLNGTSAPKVGDLINNYGMFAKKKLIKINISFEDYVNKCLTDESYFLDAIQNASIIRRSSVKRAKSMSKPKPKKDNVFTSSDGTEIEITDEIFTRYFLKHPTELKDNEGLFKIIPNGVLDPSEPQVNALVDSISPEYAGFMNEINEESSKCKRSNNKANPSNKKPKAGKTTGKDDESSHPYSTSPAPRPQRRARRQPVV